jgi:hypothetical protein
MKKSLYLPDYSLVAFPEYWERPASKRPQTLQEVCDLLLPLQGIRGIWEVTASDNRTGEILERNILKNAITDNAAGYAIGNLFYASGASYAPMNVMCISTDAGSTALTTALVATTVYTSLAVSALPAAIASGTTLKIDYATGSEESVVTSAPASLGATSISVTSFAAAFSHAIGKTVVPVALVTDNPSSSPTGAQYLSLIAGDFSAVAFTTGVGNRTRTVTKKFPGASTTAATYTQARLCNANPIVSGSVGAACIVPQAVINGTTDQTFAVVIKL